MNFLVTGGASGLGYAVTTAIAAKYEDAQVYFTYCSSAEKAKDLTATYKNLHAIKCDFTNAGELEELCKNIGDNDIDVLINNALTNLDKQYFHKTTDENFTGAFTADVLSTLKITKAFILNARKKKSGRIITILTAALQSVPPIGWSVYLANKAYLLSMHKSWVAENSSFNITSNCISPDFMYTPLHSETDSRVIENMIAKHPLKKLLTVEEVAEVVTFLCAASSQLNGQNIVINSGMS